MSNPTLPGGNGGVSGTNATRTGGSPAGGTAMNFGGDSAADGGNRHTGGTSGITGYGGMSGYGGKLGYCWASPGEACGTTWDCCDGRACVNGHCDDCIKQNARCTRDDECCTGNCNSRGKCGDAGDGCYVKGTQCEVAADCCSGQCIPNSTTGGKICAALDGCQPLGEYCGINNLPYDPACCSGVCSPTTLHCETLRTCLARGETCDVGMNGGAYCCDAEKMTGACRGDSIAGNRDRCTASICKSGNESCFHAAECCNSVGQKPKLCLYGPIVTQPWGRCVACGVAKWSCTGNSDCCTGFACDNFGPAATYTCYESSSVGTGGTSSIATSTESCLPVNSTCSPSNTPGNGGAATTNSNPCCSPYVCETNGGTSKCVQR